MYEMSESVNSPEMRVLEAYNHYLQRHGGQEPSYDLIGARAGVSPRMVPYYLREIKSMLERRSPVQQRG